MALGESAHEAADARGMMPQLVSHAQLAADLPSSLQLAAREGVRQNVSIASAVSDYHPIAEASELRQLLELEKDELHQV